MKHSEIGKWMPDYLEGDLDLEKRALFDAHLDDCTECATDVDGMRQTLSLLHTLDEPQPSFDLSQRIMQRIEAGETRKGWRERLGGFFGPLLEPRILAPISAGAVVLGLFWGTHDLRLLDGSEEVPGRVTSVASVTQGQFPVRVPVAPVGSDEIVGLGHDNRSLSPDGVTRLTPRQEMVALSRLLASTSPLGKVRLQVWPNPPLVAGSNLGFSESVPEMQTVSASPASLGSSRSGGIPGAQARMSRSNQLSADEWLARLRSDASGFAARLSSASLTEQELWVKYLAQRAVEQDSLDEVLDSLRSSPSRHARLLADDFEAAALR